jgi:hypothetical protein
MAIAGHLTINQALADVTVLLVEEFKLLVWFPSVGCA